MNHQFANFGITKVVAFDNLTFLSQENWPFLKITIWQILFLKNLVIFELLAIKLELVTLFQKLIFQIVEID